MSADSSAPARDDLPTVDEYDEKLDLLEDLIRNVHEKIMTGRIRDEEKERARQGWHRVLRDHVAEWRKMKNDRDVAEIAEELEELKTRQEGNQ
jgi:hypothetical protein